MRLKAIPAMLSMVPSLFRAATPEDLDRIRTIVRANFPTVPQISTEALAELIEQKPRDVLLADVRSEAEFAVSHLPGAVNLQKTAEILNALKDQKPTIILYCAVGYRSSAMAAGLIRQGIENVWNVDGSIFKWANEHRPLVCNGVGTDQVHAYGRKWAGMLRPRA